MDDSHLNNTDVARSLSLIRFKWAKIGVDFWHVYDGHSMLLLGSETVRPGGGRGGVTIVFPGGRYSAQLTLFQGQLT